MPAVNLVLNILYLKFFGATLSRETLLSANHTCCTERPVTEKASAAINFCRIMCNFQNKRAAFLSFNLELQ